VRMVQTLVSFEGFNPPSRAGTTAQALGKIRSAFPQWGNGATTGGNASQVTDGTAAVVLMRRSKAIELGVKILAKYVTTAVAGKCIPVAIKD
jgi:acetyl-CoA acyltransferase 1